MISKVNSEAKNIIDQLVAKIEEMKAKQASIVAEIKEKEKEYLDNVKQNSKKWNSRNQSTTEILDLMKFSVDPWQELRFQCNCIRRFTGGTRSRN